MYPPLNRPQTGTAFGEREERLIDLLTGGGDARITLQSDNGLNKYLSAPYPRNVLAYSSSTVSDISRPAFDHLLQCNPQPGDYRAWLARLAQRIRAAYAIDDNVRLVFAPSGTDLEFVALAAVLGSAGGRGETGGEPRGQRGVHNILLGADEIGSGCIHSARGRYFATETALGLAVEPERDVPGIGPVSIVDVPVRCSAGTARSSATIAADMRTEIATAQRAGKHCLVHTVHGSKTGLVLPALSDIAALQSEFGDEVTFVVDACQARITSDAIAGYLDRDAIVLMTGSKFIGAPPFNGWALIPERLAARAAPLPDGFSTLFRRAEWPAMWPGADQLPDTENLSLALRLEAAVFELERFQAIPVKTISAIIAAFETALTDELIVPLGARRVLPGGMCEDLPIEMRTLATIDVSGLAGMATFDEAQRVHKRLALGGVRLGQPVKCVALAPRPDQPGGPFDWGGTLRVGLSMPQITAWSMRPIEAVTADIASDMRTIARALQTIVTAADA